LGVDLDKRISWFVNPITHEEIYIFMNPAHMLKLIRNTLGDYGILYDENGKKNTMTIF